VPNWTDHHPPERAPATTGDQLQHLRVNGVDREYLLHVPPPRTDQAPCPLVLAFHGGGSNAAVMREFCGLNALADEAGFLVAYPNGTGRVPEARTWNAGNCCGHAVKYQVDDVAFVRTLLDDLAQRLPLDTRRVYVTGMSNGGMLCYRLASELADRFAAIAPVGGPMGTETCHPSRPVPLIHFHGTDDEFAPYHGGRGARSLTKTNFYSVDHTLAQWVRANRCAPDPEITEETPLVADGTRIIRKHWRPPAGTAGADVVLYTIAGGGHTWPGRPVMYEFLGTATRNLDANRVMWDFFQHATPR